MPRNSNLWETSMVMMCHHASKVAEDQPRLRGFEVGRKGRVWCSCGFFPGLKVYTSLWGFPFLAWCLVECSWISELGCSSSEQLKGRGRGTSRCTATALSPCGCAGSHGGCFHVESMTSQLVLHVPETGYSKPSTLNSLVASPSTCRPFSVAYFPLVLRASI